MSISGEAARKILRDNDRGGYTVPTAGLYPYQWNWDAAFVAMGWITFDESRAWREFERLLEGQWADGMLPHIVFHGPKTEYFPGPDVWKTKHSVATSGISQPPVLATAVRHCWQTARDRALAEDRVAVLFPRILAWHRWWVLARDPEGIGLVGCLHPWESGMDNSPAWDEAFARVSPTPTTPIRRSDTGHVGADMRPSGDFYRRVIALIDLYASLDWEPRALWARAPFKVADLAINSILHRANQDLLALAVRFGTAAERAEISARMELTAAALNRLWSDAAGLYLPLDLIVRHPIEAPVSAGFLPLWAGVADAARIKTMAATLARWGEKVRYLVPSTSPIDPRFESKRYWRGPVWCMMNMMIAEGFRATGAGDFAARIKADTASLISRAGFSEYFDPQTGAGLGGSRFSWTASVALSWPLL
jgi:hypothetical protein